MIYFLQTSSGSIKIGFTTNLESRIESLGKHYGERLTVLRTMEGDKSEEREMHRRFSHLRCGMTEQFQPGTDLMEFIGGPLSAGSDPDAVKMTKPRHVNASIPMTEEERECLERIARSMGLNVPSYIRMAVKERMRADRERNGS